MLRAEREKIGDNNKEERRLEGHFLTQTLRLDLWKWGSHGKLREHFRGKEHPVQSLEAVGAELGSIKEIRMAELKSRSRHAYIWWGGGGEGGLEILVRRLGFILTAIGSPGRGLF